MQKNEKIKDTEKLNKDGTHRILENTVSLFSSEPKPGLIPKLHIYTKYLMQGGTTLEPILENCLGIQESLSDN